MAVINAINIVVKELVSAESVEHTIVTEIVYVKSVALAVSIFIKTWD